MTTLTADYWELDDASVDSGNPTYTISSVSVTFSNTLNAVTDLGVDDTGSSDVSGTIESNIGGGTLIEFPPGTYRFDNEVVYSGVGGLKSTTDNPADVTFTTGTGNVPAVLRPSQSATGCYFGGITIDSGSSYSESLGGVWGNVDGNFILRDIVHLGNADASTEKEIVLNVKDPNSKGVIINWDDSDGGAAMQEYDADDLYIFHGSGTDGDIQHRNCKYHNGSENGIYSSKTSGTISAINCELVNCQPTSVRITGPNAFISECSITHDVDLWGTENTGFEELNRTIWTQTNNDVAPREAPTIVDVDVTINGVSAHGRQPAAYQTHSNSEEGVNPIVNFRAEVNNTQTSVFDLPKNSSLTDNDGNPTDEVIIDDVRITGTTDSLVQRNERDLTINDGCIELADGWETNLQNNITLNSVSSTCGSTSGVFSRGPVSVGRGCQSVGRGGEN